MLDEMEWVLDIFLDWFLVLVSGICNVLMVVRIYLILVLLIIFGLKVVGWIDELLCYCECLGEVCKWILVV